MDKSGQLTDLSEPEKVRYLLSLRDQGISTVAICRQYHVPQSTFYYWLARYETSGTYENRASAPRFSGQQKVTDTVRAEVVKAHHQNPRLGCWRLSLFDYDGRRLSRTTIWMILNEAKLPKSPPNVIYVLTRFHQIWFIDHMHLRTLPNGQKIYSLIVIDGMSRVLLSDDVILSKGARDACMVLLRAFARWGLPEEIVSDNGSDWKAFSTHR